MAIKKIFHIADLHICEKNYNNLRNSFKKLVADIISVNDYKSQVILVICGDVFEYKTHLTSDDAFVFYALMAELERSEIRTVIIPGNHDYNINSHFSHDNISILLKAGQKFITCHSKTGIYNIDNIDFYVYSPIDKLVPEFNHRNNITSIALLHEPVNSAKYDNDEFIHNGRFYADDLDQYDIVMLGDIHKPQFLRSNCAYSGSFVQKTRGEGINHGYILWDIISKTGQHIWIPLLEVSLKLQAKNNTIALPEISKITKVINVSLIHTECTSEWIENISDEIRLKYSTQINQVICRTGYLAPDISDIKISNEYQTPLFSHSTVIKEILEESKTDPELIASVISLHNNYLQNRKECIVAQYKLHYLSWSNIFCYGDNNYINFREVSGLVSLSGKNKTGKSSVIDILIRVLFNECERGYKEDILNKSAKKGHIKCQFQVGKDIFIAEQSWTKYSSTCTYRLYKNDQNITKDTIIKTYKYLKEDVGLGNYKDFVNLTTALQNRKFIIDLEKKDLYSLLCKLLDIDTMKDIEDNTKKEKDFLKRKHKEKLKEIDDLDDIDDAQLTEMAKTLLELKNKESELVPKIKEENKNIRQLERKIEDGIEDKMKTLQNTLESSSIIEDANILKYYLPKNQLKELNKKIEDQSIQFNIKKEEFKNLKSTLNKLRNNQNAYSTNKDDKEMSNKVISDNEISNMYILSRDGVLKLLNKECNSQFVVLENIPDETIQKLRKRATAPLKSVNKFQTNLSSDELKAKPIVDIDIDNEYRKLEKCKINKLQTIQEPNNMDIEELKIELNQAKNAKISLPILKERLDEYEANQKNYIFISELKYSDDCGNCSHNRTVIRKKVDYSDKIKKIVKDIENKTELVKNIKLIETQLNDVINYYEMVNQNKIFEQNKQVEDTIASYKEYQKVLYDIEQHKHIAHNYELTKLKILYDNYILLTKETVLDNLSKECIILKDKLTELKIQKTKHNNAEEHKEQLQIHMEIKQLTDKWEINKQYISELEIIQTEIETLEIELNKIRKQINKKEKQLQESQLIMTRKNDLQKQLIEIDKNFALYEAYYACVNYKTGIPSTILKKVCKILSIKCNDILVNITDFQVEFIFEDEIRIYTKIGGMKIPATMGSGFQKFILDMIMRIVLTRISNISNPNILFIDEGFGCLDKENFINVCSCLNKMKDNFDAMIVITHIPELQAYMDKTMTINVQSGASDLKYGALNANELSLHFEIAMKKIKQDLDNVKIKDSVKNVIEESKSVESKSVESKSVESKSVENKFPNKIESHNLCKKFKLLNSNELISKITDNLIELDNNNEKFKCLACAKLLKNTKSGIINHISSVSNRVKHYKYIMAVVA